MKKTILLGLGLLLFLAACGGIATAVPAGEVSRPSNPGGPGEAVALSGDPDPGEEIYRLYCQVCHGEEGRNPMANSGSDDGTVPGLDPVDPALVDDDPAVFAVNLDLYIEHGSIPAGNSPALNMPAWGDNGSLTPQQIADVIAYIIELNQ